MSKSYSRKPFKELPEALVEDMLNQCDVITENLSSSFKRLLNHKKETRRTLKERSLLKHESELPSNVFHPTTCGIDGAYAVEKLLSTDIIAIAGVAVEGLAPPTEKRYWPIPHHNSKISTVSHHESTSVLSGAIMMCLELELASMAPHNVVFFDGSLLTPFIYIIKALNVLNEPPKELSEEIDKRIISGLDSYIKILSSKKSDQIFVGVPKYTTLKEISNNVLNMIQFEDRGLLSFMLKAGEFVGPLDINSHLSEYHLTNVPDVTRNKFEEVISLIQKTQLVYYRPNIYFPALRLEISPVIANNKHRLALLFEAIRYQCGVPGILEPYPLYLADRMVKQLRKALPAIRKTTTQEMSLKWEGSPGNLYFAMHGYRTDWSK